MKRKTPNIDLGPSIEVNPLTKRKCRNCGIQLRADKYFCCGKCSYYEDDAQYDGSEYGYETRIASKEFSNYSVSDWSLI